MTPYTETDTYRSRVTKLSDNITALQATIATFSGIKLRGGTVKRKRTDEEQRVLMNAKARLKTARKKLQSWQSLKVTPWDMTHLIQASDGMLWDEVQYQLWHKELASHEGRGEASVRAWYGLIAKAATTDEIDIPELSIEVKNVQGRAQSGTLQLQTIQAGKGGRQSYSMWMGCSAEAGLFKDLPDDVRQALFTGEVKQSIIYGRLPDHVKQSLLAVIRPSIVFSHVKAIAFTTRNGFLLVEHKDLDAALSIMCVTKGGSKYSLKKEYLLNRLKATASPTNDGADVAA